MKRAVSPNQLHFIIIFLEEGVSAKTSCQMFIYPQPKTPYKGKKKEFLNGNAVRYCVAM